MDNHGFAPNNESDFSSPLPSDVPKTEAPHPWFTPDTPRVLPGGHGQAERMGTDPQTTLVFKAQVPAASLLGQSPLRSPRERQELPHPLRQPASPGQALLQRGLGVQRPLGVHTRNRLLRPVMDSPLGSCPAGGGEGREHLPGALKWDPDLPACADRGPGASRPRRLEGSGGAACVCWGSQGYD